MASPRELLQLIVCGCEDDLAASHVSTLSDPPTSDLLKLGIARAALEREADALRNGSLYSSALARGADELVSRLSDTAISVEAALAADAGLTNYHVRFALSDYVTTVPSLGAIVHAVLTGKLAGGALLDALHAKAADGDRVVAKMFHRCVHVVPRLCVTLVAK